jgi:DNA excision repair protein ERCC-6
MKVDVARDLPSKQEFVLMCKLTKYQKQKYLEYLRSIELKANSYLGAITTLRKICNHPDLADVSYLESEPGYGDPSRSGKIQVLKSLIVTWTKEKHKILLFTQTRQMMNILEKFLNQTMGPDFKYMRMSGETNIGKRQDMIFQFNNEDYNLFLLTTKVGGLGVNLTGADRVIIFDPDWNPSTDLQARERAWRLGQKKEVLIYRLVIGGSIEEKIYHRQIFKQLLTDKILKDPNQKRFFKNHELHDLFTLSDFDDNPINDLLNANMGNNIDDLSNLSKIQGVSKLEKFKDQTEDETEEDRLMDGLLKSAKIQAVKHDEMVDSHSKPSIDIVDQEARIVAQKALDALKTSRKQVKKAGVGVPTFTGKFGIAGKVSKIKKRPGSGLSAGIKDNNSSLSILSNLKKQKEKESQNITTDADTKMIEDMRAYLSKQEGYFAKSADILKSCNIEIKEQHDLSTIRSMLKGIGKWDGERKGWVLLNEFR